MRFYCRVTKKRIRPTIKISVDPHAVVFSDVFATPLYNPLFLLLVHQLFVSAHCKNSFRLQMERDALVYQCYVVQPWCERLRCRVRAREAGQLTTPCTVLINSHSTAAAALGPTLIGQSSLEHRAPNTPLPTVTPHTFSWPIVT